MGVRSQDKGYIRFQGSGGRDRGSESMEQRAKVRKLAPVKSASLVFCEEFNPSTIVNYLRGRQGREAGKQKATLRYCFSVC